MSAAETQPSPYEIARAHLANVEVEGKNLNAKFLEFRRRYSVRLNAFGVIVSCRTDTLNGRAAIEAEWRALQKRGAAWTKAWSEALSTLAIANREG